MGHLRISLLERFFLLCFFLSSVFGIYTLEAFGNSKECKKKESVFSGLVLPPTSGQKPDSIVVLFHGYGDNAENFLLLGALLGQVLPNTLFVAPEGPIACKNIPSGKQWLRASKNNQLQLLKEIKNLTPSLNQYLDDLLKTYRIPPEKMALMGFSQGARIALHIGLRRPKCAGIAALSGSYLDDPEALNLLHPPILIIHGMEDQKAPVSLARASHKQLEALKMPVTLILLQKVAHDIDPYGLEITAEFLEECLSGKIRREK